MLAAFEGGGETGESAADNEIIAGCGLLFHAIVFGGRELRLRLFVEGLLHLFL